MAAGRKEEQSRATQERLLSAARALFAERGFAGTATEDLVARAAVTRGALYHQYADGTLPRQPIEPLAHLVIGALNEAGLAVASSPTPHATRDAFLASLDGVLEALRARARAR